MSRAWTRPLGIALTVVLIAALLVIGLRPGDSELGQQPDLRNGRVFIQDNLWSTRSRQYAVWVGPDGNPYAGSRREGHEEWKVSNLGRLNGDPFAAPTADDEHNVFATAVDAGGGVHVSGNMHGDPLRYARSIRGELSGWSERPRPAPSGSVTYPAFAGLPDGTILFIRREGVAGRGVVAMDALDPGARSWRAEGALLDGRPSGESPYLHHVAVDPRTGVIHILFEWRTRTGAEGTNDVGYATSADGGNTWETSDGARLPSPITHASAETVIDTLPSGSGLVNSGGLTVDSAGRPHGAVLFDSEADAPTTEHIWLAGGTWRRERLDDLELNGRSQLAGTPDGRVWLLGVRGTTVEAFDVTPEVDRVDPREIAEVPAGWEPSYDSQALARDGVVEMLIPRGASPNVVRADLRVPEDG